MFAHIFTFLYRNNVHPGTKGTYAAASAALYACAYAFAVSYIIDALPELFAKVCVSIDFANCHNHPPALKEVRMLKTLRKPAGLTRVPGGPNGDLPGFSMNIRQMAASSPASSSSPLYVLAIIGSPFEFNTMLNSCTHLLVSLSPITSAKFLIR